MKNNILEISKQLENSEITYQTARAKLCKLFGVNDNPIYIGKVRVNDNSNLIYAGSELNIIGVYMTHKPNGTYLDNTREFKLSLKGTKYDHEYTVINETELTILEIEIK